MARSRFGSVKRIGTDHYHVFWTEAGRRRSKRIRGTRDDALAFLAARQMEAGGAVQGITWGVYWNAVVVPSFEGLADKTIHGYLWTWERMAPHLADSMVSDLTYRQAERVVTADPAPSTQRKAKALLKKMCNMAIRDGLLDRNPVDRMMRTAPRAKREKVLIAAEEMGAWLGFIRGLKYEPLFLMEVGGGLRHEEACAMTRENVSRYEAYGSTYALVKIERGLVTVDGAKVLKGVKNEHSVREVVIGEPFASRLLELCEGVGPVCPCYVRWNGGDYRAEHFTNPTTVTNNWRTWCRQKGEPYVRPGDMRSVFATLHGEAGTPDSLVSLAMGHADGGSTKARNYQQRTRKGLMVAADSLTEYLEEAAENAVEKWL